MFFIQYTHQFEAAHRLMGHPGKCRHVHGHSYKAKIAISGELGADAMVMDFGDVKKIIGAWIDAQWDHNIILRHDDPLAKLPVEIFKGKMPYLLASDPTAEVLAFHLLSVSRELLSSRPTVKVAQVEIQETEKCQAYAN